METPTTAQPTYTVPDRDDPERGKKLRAIREGMKMSRAEFAEAVGMGASTLALYETANNNGFPFSARLTNNFKLFVEQGIKTTKKRGNASTGTSKVRQPVITAANVADYIPIHMRTDHDLVKELLRRGYTHVTLTM